MDGTTPYYFYQGKFRPICGHWFWNNNDGATSFCKKLGNYESGTVSLLRKTYDEDAINIGECQPNDDIMKCKGGFNSYDLHEKCKTGHKVSIGINCKPGNITIYRSITNETNVVTEIKENCQPT